MNGLDWQCFLAGSSKTSPRILIFLIAMGADYSFELYSIETKALSFFGHNNSFLGSVSWVCKCYSNYRNDLLLVKIAVNVVISIQWIVDYVAGVATFNLIARILGAVFMPLPLQRPAFLSLISTFIYLLIKLGAVIALVKVSIFLFLTRKSFSI